MVDTVMSTLIKLVKLSQSHLEIIRKWRNNNRTEFFDQSFISQDKHDKWFKNLHTNTTKFFLVKYRREYIGTCSVNLLNHKQVEIGNVLLGDKRYSRMGFMGLAIKLLINKYPADSYTVKLFQKNHIALNFYLKNKFVIASKEKKYTIMLRTYESK